MASHPSTASEYEAFVLPSTTAEDDCGGHALDDVVAGGEAHHSKQVNLAVPRLRGSRLAIVVGVSLAVLAAAACVTRRLHCARMLVGGSTEAFASLVEVDPGSLLETPEDRDAMTKWLQVASSAGSAADAVPRTRGGQAKADQAIQDAMSIQDPVEAEKMVKNVMRHAAVKTQSLRRALKARAGSRKGRQGRTPGQKASVAFCVFNVLKSVNALAFGAANINDAIKTCPKGVGAKPDPICLLNGLFAFSTVTSLLTSLSNAATNCAATIIPNVNAQCAASVGGLITALGEAGATGAFAVAACPKDGLNVSGLVPSSLGSVSPSKDARRLVEVLNASADGAEETAPQRRLVFGGGKRSTGTQCFVFASQSAWALASAALYINSAANVNAGNTCPPKNLGLKVIKGPVYELSQGLCTVDVAGIIGSLAQTVLFLQLSVMECADTLNLKALCGAGIDGIVGSMAAMAQAATGLHLACDKLQGPLWQAAIKTANMAGKLRSHFNIGRRLEEMDGQDSFMDDVMGRFKTPEEAWQSMGIDLNDPKAPFRSAKPDFLGKEEIASLMENVVEPKAAPGLFADAAGCEA